MNRIGSVLVVPVLAIAGLIATARARAQDSPEHTQYRALLQEFQKTARGLYEATTDEQRSAVTIRMAELSPRVLAWAESNAGDPLALDGLVQVVVQEIWLENNTAYPGPQRNLEDRAIAILLQHHIGSDRLAEGCTRMCYGFGRQCEGFLRTVLERSPHRDVQGLACLRLAQFLNGRLRRLDLLALRPEMAARYEHLFGKDYLEELRRQDRAPAMKQIEAIFERAAREFRDTKLPYDQNVGETADSELHEIRHLSIGKQALELQGQDQDGEAIKLSDYRGKVVLLYFWSEY
ncbi:MAG TPA: redoxin domain-containing protein [Planctomycetota bacterium]|nr:redoxin domain-containing protein [Planctomycetota bacterium]